MKSDVAGRVAVGFSIACVLTVVATVGILVMPAVRLKLGLPPRVPPSYPVGTRIDVPASVYAAAPYTLVLFARSDCPVCERVKPWLADLKARLEGQTSTRVVLVASGSQLSEELLFASEIGLAREQVVPLAPGPIKAKQVPTLVLVDRAGTVLHAQEGAQGMAGFEAIGTIISLVQNR